MNGSRESGVRKGRSSRFQVQGDHEPGNDIGAMRDRVRQGRRVAQSRYVVIGIREFVHGRNGDTRRRSGIAGRAALRRGRRAWRGSATGSRQARWSASSWLRPSRWRSRGETGLGIAARGRARGREGQALTAHATTVAGCRGLGRSLRALRWRAASSRGRAGSVLSRTREARAAPARSAAPRCASGARRIDRRADPQRRTDRLLVAGSAPPSQAGTGMPIAEADAGITAHERREVVSGRLWPCTRSWWNVSIGTAVAASPAAMARSAEPRASGVVVLLDAGSARHCGGARWRRVA